MIAVTGFQQAAFAARARTTEPASAFTSHVQIVFAHEAARSRCSLVLALLIALPCGASAPPLTLSEARRLAADAAPDVQLAGLRIESARHDIGLAQTWANPTLSVGTGLRSAKLSTGVALPLELFGQRGTAVDAASADLETLVREAQVVRADARWAATLAWLDLWEAQARERLLTTASSDAAQLEAIATAKLEAGAGSKLDLLRAQAEARRAAADANAFAHLAQAASARLEALIGTPHASTLGAPDFEFAPADLAPLLASLAKHPVAQRDRASLSAADAHLEAERRLRWPTLSAQLTVTQFDPSLTGPDVIGGVSFELPVFNLRGASIAKSQVQRQTASVVQELDERRLRAAITDAWERSVGTHLQLTALHEQVIPSLEEARTLTDEAFRLGTVDLLRVLDARRALLDNRLAELAASSAWARAMADLERATGLHFDENTHAP